MNQPFRAQWQNGLSSENDLFIQDPLCTACDFFLVYVCSLAKLLFNEKVPLVIIIIIFTVVSVVWDGLCFTSKCPGSPSSLPDPCNPGLLAPPLPHSSASNKQPLINHALLITQALVSALVCEIYLLCTLLCQRPHDSVLHIFQDITVSGLFPPPDPLFSSPFHFFFFHHYSPCHILMPPLDPSHMYSVSLDLSFYAKNKRFQYSGFPSISVVCVAIKL